MASVQSLVRRHRSRQCNGARDQRVSPGPVGLGTSRSRQAKRPWPAGARRRPHRDGQAPRSCRPDAGARAIRIRGRESSAVPSVPIETLLPPPCSGLRPGDSPPEDGSSDRSLVCVHEVSIQTLLSVGSRDTKQGVTNGSRTCWLATDYPPIGAEKDDETALTRKSISRGLGDSGGGGRTKSLRFNDHSICRILF
jgi:hypothetical protein